MEKRMFGRHQKPRDWRDCCVARAADEPDSLLCASALRRFGGAFEILAGEPCDAWEPAPQA
jgi:hypothetical protein